MPSKWENFAHNGLICFFQHNYLPTFEQWSWDRVCVLSTWFGDICGSRRDLYVLQTEHSHFISNSIDLFCYCAITELVMIWTSATHANKNSDDQNGSTQNGKCRLGSHNVKNGTAL